MSQKDKNNWSNRPTAPVQSAWSAINKVAIDFCDERQDVEALEAVGGRDWPRLAVDAPGLCGG